MKTIPWFYGNALAGFLDFSVGVLIATLTAHFFGVELAWWQLWVGGVLALLPDFDIAFLILAEKRVNSDHHKSPLHKPLLMLPLVGLIGYAIGGDYWELTALLCVLWHFIHDTPGFGGGGIAWAWPISKKYWSLTGAHPLIHASHEEWIRDNWLRPSRMSVREVGLGTLALVIAFLVA
jgi:hypothetical protein